MADTFTCDNCGREFPTDQMKEVFSDAGGDVQRQELCAPCLDEKMNEAADVYGVEGQEKRRAAYLAQSSGDAPDDGATGKRE
ncbi:MAG TPA: hypothetical protein VG929_07605 [Actinomycetota bacterium]|nr:hypothetical protein [Actinomycetota bacterium]